MSKKSNQKSTNQAPGAEAAVVSTKNSVRAGNGSAAPAFDPNAAAPPGAGLFGLACERASSRVVITPVQFDATTSYGGGASAGPGAVFEASMQVDLLDHQFGDVWKHGIFMAEANGKIAKLSRKARALAEPIIEAGGIDATEGKAGKRLRKALTKVNAASATVNEHVYERTRDVLKEGKLPGLLGGDHSTPLGAIRACAEHLSASKGGKGEGLGILHVDAHMDLRDAFEGFTYSHASVMFNVLRECKGVSKIVQVGIRDYCAAEKQVVQASKGRVSVFYDQDIADEINGGGNFLSIARRAVESLPANVYVSFDIDALEPSLCPHTGTPVPGGLAFAQAALLLKVLSDSGRRVVGFDLVEVCPSPRRDDPPIDESVGARVLYKLCGAACAAGA
ncbi:MAG: arginase family protein [Phycisphaerales bacterium]